MAIMNDIENAVIIGGVVYELIDDDKRDECARCDLLEECAKITTTICAPVFGNTIGQRFKRIEA